ncbi:hypothetical protein HOY82DRAFT_537184 [Tuber indicum]|nr:hypothetical protein HOY82DRAFT_537184 [Tuber indicum]
MSENAQLRARIRELEYIVEESREDAKRTHQFSVQQKQYYRSLIDYQDHRLRAQEAQIKSQEAKIQNMMENHASHCEDMSRQMRFLEGIAYGGDETPEVEKEGDYRWEYSAEDAHEAESKLAPREEFQSGPPATRNLTSNLTSNLDQEGYHGPAPADLPVSPVAPPRAPLSPRDTYMHDIELLRQIGINLFPECPAEISPQEPQATTHQLNGWRNNQEQFSQDLPEMRGAPGPVAPLPPSKGPGRSTGESTQGYKGSVRGTIHRGHRSTHSTEVRGSGGRISGSFEKPKSHRIRGSCEIHRKEKLNTRPY